MRFYIEGNKQQKQTGMLCLKGKVYSWILILLL